VIAQARTLAARMRADHPEVARIYLVGSFAYGQPGPHSDLDLVVIVRDTAVGPRDRSAHYAPLSPRPVDLLVYTADEVARVQHNLPPLLAIALRQGIEL